MDLIRPYLSPGCSVGDFGCGGGALLDLVKQVTGGPTFAIEPFAGYHSSLGERGHAVFLSAQAASAVPDRPAIDLALSFHVIEHTPEPVAYLREIRELSRPNGLLVVLTPNLDDILMRFDSKRMSPFFYRRVHNYYFTAKALAWAGRLAGWEPVKDIFYHEFGLANTLLWLRDGQPAGHASYPGVDATADDFWRTFLERTSQTNNVGMVFTNPPHAAD